MSSNVKHCIEECRESSMRGARGQVDWSFQCPIMIWLVNTFQTDLHDSHMHSLTIAEFIAEKRGCCEMHVTLSGASVYPTDVHCDVCSIQQTFHSRRT